jgi:ABC-type dipeptide/oligopeptide/nickel transport system permease component
MPAEQPSTPPSMAADTAAAEARASLLRGDRVNARRLAVRALELDRQSDLGWLVLAALSPADRRREVLEQAAGHCPESARLRKALAATPPRLAGMQAVDAPSTPPVAEEPRPASISPEAAAPARAEEPASDLTPDAQEVRPGPASADPTQRLVRTPWGTVGRIALRRLVTSLLVLVAIAYLAAFGLLMARRGQAGLPAEPATALVEAARSIYQYAVQHPATYYMAKADQAWWSVAGTAFLRSAALLFLSLAVATLVGMPLGMWAATRKRRWGSALILTLSILGVSTPSFLLAMLFWIADFKLYRLTGTAPFPPTGFGWDLHLVMPVLVLATRPLAQVAQVTYVTLSEALSQDYMRTALGKGLSRGGAVWQHALRNVWIPVLTAIGTSMRFSLASLPVVESFFLWPGLGLLLLAALEQGMDTLILDLLLGLGLLFLVINSLLDVAYPLLDPRLRQEAVQEERRESVRLRDRLAEAGDALRDILRGLLLRLRGWIPARRAAPLRPAARAVLSAPLGAPAEAPALASSSGRLRRGVMLLVTNPAFVAGSLLLLGLLGLGLAGGSFTEASAYETHGIIMIEGELASPPFKPSPSFPWGSDAIGRDIQALVLEGARRTLALAIIATLARLGLGTALGLAAGWWQRGWFDRLLSAAIGVWAAFPVTLFAMILIYGMGIQQGFWIFVIALCVVGWGEIAQFTRGLVIRLKSQPFVEGARAVGARADQILLTQILPNMTGPLLVAASLETAGVLMLLAELGFLNVFMGGGFRAMIGETGRMAPVIYYFSDVPEWSALLANIRNWWRSYPWLGWYPGVAFFLAIIAFNLWGEGLRRFLDDTRLNLSRLLNRNLMLVGAGAALVVALILNAVAPSSQYRDAAVRFDAAAVQADIAALSSPAAEGRETGMPGARIAAEYIARRMADLGLQPAGVGNTFLQTQVRPRFHLSRPPRLEVLDAAGGVALAFRYRQDFAEYPLIGTVPFDQARPTEFGGPVFGCAVGRGTDPAVDKIPPLQELEGIAVVLEGSNCPVSSRSAVVSLMVSNDPGRLGRKYLYPQSSYLPPGFANTIRPVLYISAETADALLATAGSSLQALEALRDSLPRGGLGTTGHGAIVRAYREGFDGMDETGDYINVIGYIPGTGALVEQVEGRGLDRQVIIVSAYYDGLGTLPDGVLYPGANDNASGVAMMLEMARQMLASPYQPRKTVLFVAWAGGERRESLSLVEIMNAKIGFSSLTPEAVIELSGVGAGTLDQAAIGEGSSFRLIQLFQDAAAEFDLKTTTRGRGPHFNLPAAAAFGGRSATTLALSWDGADATAHTPQDTPEWIDPDKLERLGRSALLTLLILSRETVY